MEENLIDTCFSHVLLVPGTPSPYSSPPSRGRGEGEGERGTNLWGIGFAVVNIWNCVRVPVLIGAVTLVLAGCAGLFLTSRPVISIGEVPTGDYNVRVLSVLAPTEPPDGETVAAVLYTTPAGAGIEVSDFPHSWLWEHSLGKGTGREHLTLVKSPANYVTVTLTDKNGRTIGYAVLHRVGVHAALQDSGEKTLLILSTLNLLDHNYIHPGGSDRASVGN